MPGPHEPADPSASSARVRTRRFRLLAFALDDPGDAHSAARRVAEALDLSWPPDHTLSPDGRRLYIRVPQDGPRSMSDDAILAALQPDGGTPVPSGPGAVDERLCSREAEPIAIADLDDVLDWLISTRRRTVVGARTVRSALVVDRLRAAAASRPDLLRGHIQLLAQLDASGRTDYLSTLMAYFDHGGDAARAADAMFMHPNTVRYRLRRIQELSGLNLDDPIDRFVAEFQLRVLGPAPAGSSRLAHEAGDLVRWDRSSTPVDPLGRNTQVAGP